MIQKQTRHSIEGKNIKVFVRVRPFNEKEHDRRNCIDQLTQKTICLKERQSREQYKFKFDKVFNQTTTQEDIYQNIGQKLVCSAFDGINGTILCYGQTSSGKTYTCVGPNLQNSQMYGLLPRLIKQTLNKIKDLPNHVEAKMKISMVEIYNEKIRDLLNSKKSDLKIRSNKSLGIHVHEVTQKYILNYKQAFFYLRLGLENRAVGYTNMNARSSRSHMVFLINLYSNNLYNGTAKVSKLTLVDLAGSQKLCKIGTEGKNLEQTKKINTSLTALGKVINTLSEGKSSHIPYRDSKLTRLLQESLGGNSITNLIINISPSSINDLETLNSIRFGWRAKAIKTLPKVNRSYTVTELLSLLEKAEQKIKELTKVIVQLNGKKKRTGSFGSLQLPAKITMHIIRDHDDEQSEFAFSESEFFDSEAVEVKSSLQCPNEDEGELKFWKTTESWKEKINKEKLDLCLDKDRRKCTRSKDEGSYSSENQHEFQDIFYQQNKEGLSPRNYSTAIQTQRKQSTFQEQQCMKNLTLIKANLSTIKNKYFELKSKTIEKSEKKKQSE